MNFLFFDTETTGKADMNGRYDAPHQPHIVQLAAILMDESAKEIMSVNLIVRPEGWTIPDEAAAIHGITNELAEAVGVPIRTALNVFGRMRRSAEMYVAHNIDFDVFMMECEMVRSYKDDRPVLFEEEFFCTMKQMTDICKIPGPYGFKWPKLQEAHVHCFGSEFDGAHDALADVRACAKVFFWHRNRPQEVAP